MSGLSKAQDSMRTDFCRCGHSRAEHLGIGGSGDCRECGGRFGRTDFRCEPGACDRFTWDARDACGHRGCTLRPGHIPGHSDR
jgi:hypothetical protein